VTRQVRVVIEGESYLSLETVAECYHCEVSWVREVYEFGLLGSGRRVGSDVVIPSHVLDRLAAIIRLSRYYGLNLAGIALALDLDEP